MSQESSRGNAPCQADGRVISTFILFSSTAAHSVFSLLYHVNSSYIFSLKNNLSKAQKPSDHIAPEQEKQENCCLRCFMLLTSMLIPVPKPLYPPSIEYLYNLSEIPKALGGFPIALSHFLAHLDECSALLNLILPSEPTSPRAEFSSVDGEGRAYRWRAWGEYRFSLGEGRSIVHKWKLRVYY